MLELVKKDRPEVDGDESELAMDEVVALILGLPVADERSTEAPLTVSVESPVFAFSTEQGTTPVTATPSNVGIIVPSTRISVTVRVSSGLTVTTLVISSVWHRPLPAAHRVEVEMMRAVVGSRVRVGVRVTK